MTDRKERVKQLKAQKDKAEEEIDALWKEIDAIEKQKEDERKKAEAGGPMSYVSALLPSPTLGKLRDIDAIRKRVARINDELMVNLLDSIDDHSNKLEWLTYALIFTSVVLIALTGVQIWRALG